MTKNITLKSLTCASCAAIAMGGFSVPAAAGTDAYLGEITAVGFNFCPRGTAETNGALLAINSNQALFSLLGTTFGGDGRTTFALPDLRGRSPMHMGTGPGLSPRQWGQRIGTETNTLNAAQMPAHSHNARLNVSRVTANTPNPINAYFARAAGNTFESGTNLQGDQMNAGTVTVDNAGGGQAVNNMQPTLVVRYCITTQGVFPSRN